MISAFVFAVSCFYTLSCPKSGKLAPATRQSKTNDFTPGADSPLAGTAACRQFKFRIASNAGLACLRQALQQKKVAAPEHRRFLI
jgi:hypothetical protein